MKNNIRKVAVETKAKAEVKTETKVKAKIIVSSTLLSHYEQELIHNKDIKQEKLNKLNETLNKIFCGTFQPKYFNNLAEEEQDEVVEYSKYDNLQRLFLCTRLCNIHDADIAGEIGASVTTIRQYLSKGISRAIRIHSRDLPNPEHRIEVGKPVKNKILEKTIIRLGYMPNREKVDPLQKAIKAVEHLEYIPKEERQEIINKLIERSSINNYRK